MSEGMKMDEKEAVELLKFLKQEKSGDVEAAHYEADALVMEFLTSLGHEEIVQAWKEIPKWYA
jgi:hypothetical protein